MTGRHRHRLKEGGWLCADGSSWEYKRGECNLGLIPGWHGPAACPPKLCSLVRGPHEIKISLNDYRIERLEHGARL